MRYRFLRTAAFIGIGTALFVGVAAPRAEAGLKFNLVAPNTINPLAKQGFLDAAALWSNVISTNITVNINIDFASLGGNILGQTDTGSFSVLKNYTDILPKLQAAQTSADDAIAVANLQTTGALTLATTDKDGNSVLKNAGNVSAINASLEVTGANAKALGFLAADDAGTEASIKFNSDFAANFDFNRSDGVGAGKTDFVGVAAHEIGHALGFISGVDVVDAVSGPKLAPGESKTDLNGFTIYTTLDLFRYSNSAFAQVNNKKVLDLRQGTDTYFSIDGGATNTALFSTGSFDGDGNQASHWKSRNPGNKLGIMDPIAYDGEELAITQNDLRAFDVIGYTLSGGSAAAPEPGTLALLILGVGTMVARRRKK